MSWPAFEPVFSARIFKLLRNPGIDSKKPIHSLAGRYDNPIPSRFLGPIDCFKIPVLDHRRLLEYILESLLAAISNLEHAPEEAKSVVSISECFHRSKKNNIFIFLLKEGATKIVRTIPAHTKSTNMIFKTLKKCHLMTQSL
jgi:hypothetical protein